MSGANILLGGSSPTSAPVANPAASLGVPAPASSSSGGGFLSGLFNGQPVPPQPTGADTSTQYPLWLQQYTYDLASASQNLANSPYSPVPFPQVASPSAATQQAQQMALNNVGNYQPNLNQAGALTQLAGTLAQNNTGYQPTLAGAIGGAQNAQVAATQNTGYVPTLGGALSLAQGAAQPITGQQINQYMSPYLSNVVGSLEQASANNLTQNILPQIQSQFVSAGQAASPQQMQGYNNAIYQSNQALDQSVSGALQSGYQGAVNTALAEQQAQQAGANQLSSIAGLQQGLGASNIQQYLAASGQLGNLAQEQQGLGASNIQQMGQVGAQLGQLGSLQSQLGALDVGQVAASGQAQDVTNQANINAALNNFYAQQQWPYQNLGFASNIIRGQQIPTNQTQVGLSYYPGQAYTPSPLSSFIGSTLGATALQGNNTAVANNNAAAPTNTGVTTTPGGTGGYLRGGQVRTRRLAGRQRGALSMVA